MYYTNTQHTLSHSPNSVRVMLCSFHIIGICQPTSSSEHTIHAQPYSLCCLSYLCLFARRSTISIAPYVFGICMQTSIAPLLTRIAMRRIITDSSCTSWHGVVAVVVVIIVITVSTTVIDCSLTQCDQQRDEILFQQLHHHVNVSRIDQCRTHQLGCS